MTGARGRRIGMVGAGRSRNGLGPFLAQQLEAHGARVVAVCGRDRDRAAANAADLGTRLGHPIAAAADLDALCRGDVDALVVCSPAEHHLAALQAAAAYGLDCLCEKPLVLPEQLPAAEAAVAEFSRLGRQLLENCQWPLVLPAVAALCGDGRGPVRRVAMGMSPFAAGAGPMLRDALPHLLSVVGAVVGERALAGLELEELALDTRAADATACRLDLGFRWSGPKDASQAGAGIAAELHLRQVRAQPRPAWLALDDRRIDRRIGPDYTIEFTAGERALAVADPMHRLVGAFVAGLREPERRAAVVGNAAVLQRARLYAAVLARAGL